MTELKLKQGKALVIVAHPDDEVIWMGGAIMRNPRVDWTVYSLCRSSDTDREPKFRRVSNLLRATPIISDLEDEDVMSVKESVPVIKDLISGNIQGRFNYVFSHGQNGEYGHIRHLGVHRAVSDLFAENKLLADNLFFFNYNCQKEDIGLIRVEPKPDTDLILELSEEELARKKRIVAEMYGYPSEGIDVNLCANPEAFKIYNN